MRTAAARSLGACLLLATLASGLAACTDGASSSSPSPEPTSEPTTVPTEKVDLLFGVYGSNDEIAVYTDDGQALRHRQRPGRRDRDGVAATTTGCDGRSSRASPLPDVFLVSRRDLRWFTESGLTRPVDTLLDERGVDFGDTYARDALEAFSSDNRLQCMPYGVSPQVVFYNEDLVDFARMELRGLDVPADHRRWNWDQFVAAANFAARPARGTKGVAIDPTLGGIAPFVYSGGGDLFDDDNEPTSLAFSSDDTQGALETTLQLLRDPKVTLSEEQLADKSARVVRAGQGRDDHRHPRPGARAA